MSKKIILSYILIIFGLLAAAILLSIVSYPYAEKMKDPDPIEDMILIASAGLLFIAVFIIPIFFVIQVIKAQSKPNLTLK